MSATPTPAAPTAARTRLEGSTVAGGEATRRRAAKLLGVEALGRLGAEVLSAAWSVDHLEVEVAQPGGAGSVLFQLERHRPGRPCFLTLGQLDLTYRGQALDPRLEAAVRAVSPRALGRLTLEALADLVAADPASGRPGEPLPSPDEAGQADHEEHALLSSWGSAGVWTSFFATAELARSQLDSLDFFDRCTFVQHCDQECLCVSPQTGVPMVPVVLYPWEDRIRRIDWGDRTPRRAFEGSPGMVTTDLDELDVVMGRGPARLDAALGGLEGRALGAMAFCSCTCVPVVAGEDVEAVVERHRSRLPVPLLFLTTSPASMQGVFRELLVAGRLRAEAGRPTPPERSVNLVGFAPGPPLEELTDLLALAGVEVSTVLLPALSPELVERFARARLNVFHPNELWRGHYDQLRFDSALPAIEPPAPYGVVGTRRWLEAVAAALGLDPALEAVLGERLSAAEASLERGRAEAARHRVGLVVRAAEAHLLSDPAQTWGVPVVGLLDELGFSLDVLVHEGEAGGRSHALEALAELLRGLPRHRLRSFGSPAELAELLGDGSLSAVYTERFYDRRLSELGLAAVSGQLFEHGLTGAVRAQARLLEVCRTPFFRRYGRHLAAAARARGLPDPLGRPEPGPEERR